MKTKQMMLNFEIQNVLSANKQSINQLTTLSRIKGLVWNKKKMKYKYQQQKHFYFQKHYNIGSTKVNIWI